MSFREKIIKFLRWSEKYTKTDMVYLAKGGFWQVFNKGATFLIGFATMSALSRWLSKETFGAYQYVLSIVAILSLSTLPAMKKALNRAIAKRREGMLVEVIKEKLKWSFLGVIASLVVSGWYLWQGNAILGYSFLMASFLFPLPRFFNNYTPFWQGRKRFDVDAKQTVAINLMEALTFLPVVYFTNNLLLIFLAYFISRSIFRGLAFKYCLSKTANNEKDDETLSYGKHLTVLKVIGTVAGRIDKVLVWQLLGPVQVAVYSFAKLPASRLRGLLPISTLAFPKLSEGGEVATDKLLKKFLKMFLVSIPLALAAAVIMPYLYRFVFPDYLEAIPYAQALTVTIALVPFSLLSTSFTAEMKKRELYIIQTVSPLLKIALFAVLIPLYQVWGVIMAMIASSFISGGLTFYLFKKS